MTSMPLHPLPRWRTIASEQLRSVGLGLRNEGIAFVLLLALLGAFTLANLLRMSHTPGTYVDFNYGPAAATLTVVVGMLITFGVWRNESPARRAYHWAMPVPRTTHALTRLLAGWFWLMATVLVYIAFIAVLIAMVRVIIGPNRFVPAPEWTWLVPFTSATVAYLFASAAVVGSESPWRWIGGTLLVYLISMGFAEALKMRQATHVLDAVMLGYYGLSTLFGGLRLERTAYSLARWLSATALWAGIGAALLGVALFRRRKGS